MALHASTSSPSDRAHSGFVLGGIERGFASDDEAVDVVISEANEKAPGDAGGIVAVPAQER